MTTLHRPHLPHVPPWLSRRVLVLCLLALTFALCATPTSAANGQTPPQRTAVADSLAALPGTPLGCAAVVGLAFAAFY